MTPLAIALSLAQIAPSLMRFFRSRRSFGGRRGKGGRYRQERYRSAKRRRSVGGAAGRCGEGAEGSVAALHADTSLEEAYLADRQDARARDVKLAQAGYLQQACGHHGALRCRWADRLPGRAQRLSRRGARRGRWAAVDDRRDLPGFACATRIGSSSAALADRARKIRSSGGKNEVFGRSQRDLTGDLIALRGGRGMRAALTRWLLLGLYARWARGMGRCRRTAATDGRRTDRRRAPGSAIALRGREL